ncbi:ParB N-terminal domain-containing protein [Amycolatopsis alba]|uniref:Streptomycin biosynthesis protein n=1 Tax=Amycolatopsis alba DSM 44262 TaxID=1125972 RepID=A0A229REF8_AMYAL|nr:ParB N-terminal domain-containing protein [Amycolatopsis alba]OXM45018.1 streptomycin biosynthesis protein [Amycolatopsis alba DSM 44262]
MTNHQPGTGGFHYSEEWVPVDSLLPADSPRLAGESAEHIRVLALSEAVLPPIVVQLATRRVIDGMHRLRAARLRGRREILVRFYDGDDDDAFVIAVETNIAHGLPLSQADRTAASARIIHARPQWSDRKVASVTGLSATTVGAIRRRSADGTGQAKVSARIGLDGKSRPLDATEGRLLASDLMKRRPEAPIREIAAAAGVSPATALDVRRRLRNGEHPVPQRKRTVRPAQAGSTGQVEDQEADTPPGLDRRAVLLELGKDPSLRFTDGGRALLRWLDAHTAGMEEWKQHIDNLPPHSVRTVAKLARHNSVAWQEVLEYLESRIP